ncbi:AFG1-like ATPase-domain-containing protein [Endogone sp. FLAS-F59071]|nr:AFG1-like ATPase-domain-containing protein [Endogone sp. FLAS-F59071]|eukprot:RUS14871.1 AFG1-like ATPase-domain-containing protein [Endogone sp. FLAS-F59071]
MPPPRPIHSLSGALLVLLAGSSKHTRILTIATIQSTAVASPYRRQPILRPRVIRSQTRFQSTAPVRVPSATENSVVITEYQRLVATEKIRYDEQQMRAVIQLRNLYHKLLDYEPPQDFLELVKRLNLTLKEESVQDPAIKKRPSLLPDFPAWFQSNQRHLALVKILSNEDEVKQLTTPRGLMLCGTGKTMLMQLFFNAMPTRKKRRYHYHTFMLSIYAQIHRYQLEQQQRPDDDIPANLVNEYVLLKIAREIMQESWLICFDEFQMTDIATAVIMKQLFLYFFKMGGVIVATSNRIPQDLYKNGFQRQTYSTFLDILQERCTVYDMRSETDYRRIMSEQAKEEDAPSRKIYYGDTPEEKCEFDDKVRELIGDHEPCPSNIRVFGRNVFIPFAANGVCKIDFQQLCGTPLGPADYVALCSEYHTLILENIPQMGVLKKNEARRFITLLDAVYETKVKFYCSAAASPDYLFDAAPVPIDDTLSPLMHREMLGELQADITSPSLPNISTYDTAPAAAVIDRTPPAFAAARELEFGRLSMFTGEDERFAFRRAVSRIHEMMGREYALEAWKGGSGSGSGWNEARAGEAEPRYTGIVYSEPVYQSGGEAGDDFAEEAGYTESLSVKRAVKGTSGAHGPKAWAPRFTDAHFWAVGEEWGPRAGIWGMGLKAFLGREKDAEAEAEAKGRTWFGDNTETKYQFYFIPILEGFKLMPQL